MNNYTIEDMAHLLGYVEGYLSVKFYHVLLLIPQIKEELVVQVVNWPISVLRTFLQDDTPEVRKVLLDGSYLSITELKQQYMDTFVSLCHRYSMFPEPRSQLELTFIEAITQNIVFGIPETDYQVQSSCDQSSHPVAIKEIWGPRAGIYDRYGIDPQNASTLEHDFVTAAMMEKLLNIKLRFEYLEQKDDDCAGPAP